MVSKWLDRPGEDHPPPLRGEGDRESDMSLDPGVAGMGGNGGTKPRAGTPDEARCPLLEGGSSATCISGGFGMLDDRRRCSVADELGV